MTGGVAVFCLAVSLLVGRQLLDQASAQDQKPAAKWHLVPIPDSWKRQLGGALATKNGYAWYRCFVKVPAEWKGQKVELNVEPVDDAPVAQAPSTDVVHVAEDAERASHGAV